MKGSAIPSVFTIIFTVVALIFAAAIFSPDTKEVEYAEIGEITDIQTGEEFCVIETDNESVYSVGNIWECEEAATGKTLYNKTGGYGQELVVKG